MASIRIHIITLILFVSINNSQHWDTTETSDIIHDVKVTFRSTCIYLMYDPESVRQDDLLILIEIQKLLTLRKIPAAVISLGHYYNYGFSRCHQNRPLNILPFTDTRKSLLKISSKIYLPNAIWILFTNFQWNDTESFDMFFNDMYIPLNTEFVTIHPLTEQHALLSEVYHISKTHPLQKNSFGIWRFETGIIKTDVNFYERRNDLQGLVVKAAAITEPPVTILIEKENKLILDGFFGKIWKELERRMNFTTEYSTPADQAWGTRTTNGSFNGMIGMILKNEVQFAVTEFTMTTIRAEVVDFSIPLIDTRNCVLIRQPEAGEDISWTGFLDPYKSDTWIMIIIIVLAIISFPKIAFWIIGRIPMSVPRETEEAYHVIYIVGIFCLQGVDMPKEFLSLKMLYLVAYFLIVILSVAYSASLISFLTIQKTTLPFNSLRELIDIGTYKLGVLANSGQLNNFNNATEPLMMEAYAKLIEPDKDDLPITIEEGMQRICDESKYAFMTSLDVVLGSLDLISCKLMSVLGASIPESLAIAIAKKNPYRDLINYNLRVMQRNGILKRLRRQEWPTELPLPITLWKSVNFYNITPFLIILSGGILIGMVLVIIEQYIYSLTQKQISKPQVTHRDSLCYSALKQKIFPVTSNKIKNKKNNTTNFIR